MNGETVAWISPIFKWYRQDFEAGYRGHNTLKQFLAAYSEELGASTDGLAALRRGAFAVKYTHYSWDLNERR